MQTRANFDNGKFREHLFEACMIKASMRNPVCTMFVRPDKLGQTTQTAITTYINIKHILL